MPKKLLKYLNFFFQSQVINGKLLTITLCHFDIQQLTNEHTGGRGSWCGCCCGWFWLWFSGSFRLFRFCCCLRLLGLSGRLWLLCGCCCWLSCGGCSGSGSSTTCNKFFVVTSKNNLLFILVFFYLHFLICTF